jgi:hypothetical protein
VCQYAGDGECDDGGIGSQYSYCDYGSDCDDCGNRNNHSNEPSMPPQSPPSASIIGDPHLTLANGGRADFRGINHTFYSLLSSRNLFVNCFIEYTDFYIKKLLVHGSVMTRLYILYKPNENTVVKYRILSNELNMYNSATVYLECNNQDFKLYSFQNKTCFDSHITTNYSSMYIYTPEWKIVILGLNTLGYVNGAMKYVNVQFFPLVRSINVHGLIGQSFMSNKIINGNIDKYPTHGEFTTYSWAEGAIDGVASDYEVKNGFDHNFKQSKFNSQ